MNLGHTHTFNSHSRSDETEDDFKENVGSFVENVGNSNDTLGQKYRLFTYIRHSRLIG